jgi:hypothetical protein
MTNRTERGPVAHAGHDPLLIVQFAANDLDTRGRETAEQLVETCAECAQLASDIMSIARATAELPGAARPREFTLTAEQAALLRRRGWRGVLGRFGLGWVRTDVGRTVAAGLTTLGLAGLLVGVVPGQLASGGQSLYSVGKEMTGAPAPSAGAAASEAPGAVRAPIQPSVQSASGGPMASAAPSFGNLQPVPVPVPAASGGPSYDDGNDTAGEGAGASRDRLSTGSPLESVTDASGGTSGATTQGGPNVLLLVSLSALGLGIALFALRRMSSPEGA